MIYFVGTGKYRRLQHRRSRFYVELCDYRVVLSKKTENWSWIAFCPTTYRVEHTPISYQEEQRRLSDTFAVVATSRIGACAPKATSIISCALATSPNADGPLFQTSCITLNTSQPFRRTWSSVKTVVHMKPIMMFYPQPTEGQIKVIVLRSQKCCDLTPVLLFSRQDMSISSRQAYWESY